MNPITDIKPDVARRIRFLFSDVDHTMTDGATLPSETVAAIEQLEKAGISVIPITGRTTGWADIMIRHLPVHGVITENGGVYLRKHDSGRVTHHYWDDDETRTRHHVKYRAIVKEVNAAFPHVFHPWDQVYRHTDVAFDHGEDADLPLDDVEGLVSICKRHGAHTVVSSVHVHAWYSETSKFAMLVRFLRDVHSLDIGDILDQVACIGDSPNDEALFRHLPLSVGVSNVRDFEDRLTYMPNFVTQGHSASGFQELARFLLRHR